MTTDGSPSTILEDGEYDSDATVPSPSPLLSPPMFMAVSTTSGTAATAVQQPLNNSQQLSNSQLPDLAALTTLTTTTSGFYTLIYIIDTCVRIGNWTVIKNTDI